VPEPLLSRHPVDLLIRAVIAGTQRVTAADVEQIVERMATAPFDTRIVRVPDNLRGRSYLGQRLDAMAPSLFTHLAKRVMSERQWVEGTTPEQYLADIRSAVRAVHARLAVYERRGGSIAIALTPTNDVVPVDRQGDEPLPSLLVVFSADRGIILTGHQVTGLRTTSIPESARWLT
jgi:hypothetical protein